ncbi:MAG: YceI family protein [Sphingomonadales bacterium]|nr:YceI family protein [Sphingomonadales bacterium]
MSVSRNMSRYSSVAIALHWVLALLLFFQLALGWRLEELEGLPQFAAYQLHKTVGISILVLSLVRLAIRIGRPRPAPLPQPTLLAFLAEAVHWLLYVVMIGGPITGWIIVSTARIKVPTLLFGSIPWPHLPVGAGWNGPAEAAHSLIGWMLVGLVVLHVAGALKHHLARQDLVGRMLPLRGRGAQTIAVAVAILAMIGTLFLAKALSFGPAPAGAEPAGAVNLANEVEIGNAAINEAEAALNEAAPANEAANNAAAAEEKAPPAPWKIAAGGHLGFKADYSGSAIDGSFTQWNADILFSPDDLAGSKISVTIDLASVDTADGQRDDTLKSDTFFDVAAHPRATFRSTRITHRGGNKYRAAGTLSLHGAQKPVTLDFTLDIKGDDATVSGSAPLSRTAFGVGTGEYSDTSQIKDAVGVTFSFKAKRQK